MRLFSMRIVYSTLILFITISSPLFVYNSYADQISFGNELVDAADRGNEGRVIQLLREGNPIDGRGTFGVTALMRASFRGHTRIAKILLSSGADVDAVELGGATALHIASRQGYSEIVKLLLESDASPDATDSNGWTPLMRAANAKKPEIVSMLLAKGANPTKTNKWNNNALINAVQSNDQRVLQTFIDQGALNQISGNEFHKLISLAEARSNQGMVESLAKVKSNIAVASSLDPLSNSFSQLANIMLPPDHSAQQNNAGQPDVLSAASKGMQISVTKIPADMPIKGFTSSSKASVIAKEDVVEIPSDNLAVNGATSLILPNKPVNNEYAQQQEPSSVLKMLQPSSAGNQPANLSMEKNKVMGNDAIHIASNFINKITNNLASLNPFNSNDDKNEINELPWLKQVNPQLALKQPEAQTDYPNSSPNTVLALNQNDNPTIVSEEPIDHSSALKVIKTIRVPLSEEQNISSATIQQLNVPTSATTNWIEAGPFPNEQSAKTIYESVVSQLALPNLKVNFFQAMVLGTNRFLFRAGPTSQDNASMTCMLLEGNNFNCKVIASTEQIEPVKVNISATAKAKEVYWLQLGSFDDELSAEDYFRHIKSGYKSLLHNYDYVILLPNGGTQSNQPLYRLRVGPMPKFAIAQDKCDLLLDHGINCIVITE